MNMNQRRERIVQLVNGGGSVSFSTLKKEFPQISEMTLRRDLEYLDQAKQLIRTHGGARSVEVLVGTDDLLPRRTQRNAQEKQQIAVKAAQLLQENTTVFLDSGSTCTELARAFPDGPYMIFTTSVGCAAELARLQQPQVHMLGGQINASSLSVNGAATLEWLSHINFDIAFMGVTGYIQSRGFTCGSEEECAVKRAVIQRADRVVLLMDASKVGVTSSFTFADADRVSILVTDGMLDEKTERHLTACGIQVL